MDSRLEANAADTQGGALCVDGFASSTRDVFRLENATFARNTASRQEGGPLTPPPPPVPFLRLPELDASAAGALMLLGASPALVNCAFTDNLAELGGALVAVSNDLRSAGVLTVLNSSFDANTALLTGGALYFNNTALQMANSTLTRNTARHGGALALDGVATAALRRSVFADNGASGEGGCVHSNSDPYDAELSLTGSVALSLEGCSFVRCSAVMRGGAVALRSAVAGLPRGLVLFSDAASRFESCVAGDSGGALFVDGYQRGALLVNTTFERCAASVDGGGAALQSLTLNASGVLFEGCVAGGRGGGLSAVDATMVLQRCTFRANNASALLGGIDGSGGGGGGLFAEHGSADIFDCALSSNVARYGGAVALSGQLIVRIARCMFRDNAATARYRRVAVGEPRRVGGGALAMFAKGSLTLADSECSGNLASSTSGGCAVLAQGVVSVQNVSFVGNVAARDGGGVAIGSGLITLSLCEFRSNRAGSQGGALSAERAGRLNVAETTFSGCRALRGGAASITSCDPNFHHCVFFGNNATFVGGALWLAETKVGLTNLTFEGNAAGVERGARSTFIYGGAAAIVSSLVTVTGVLMQGNTAFGGRGGALYLALSATDMLSLRFSGLRITANAALTGGGVFCDSDPIAICAQLPAALANSSVSNGGIGGEPNTIQGNAASEGFGADFATPPLRVDWDPPIAQQLAATLYSGAPASTLPSPAPSFEGGAAATALRLQLRDAFSARAIPGRYVAPISFSVHLEVSPAPGSGSVTAGNASGLELLGEQRATAGAADGVVVFVGVRVLGAPGAYALRAAFDRDLDGQMQAAEAAALTLAPCPPSSRALAFGPRATVCAQCDVGLYSATPGQSECRRCPLHAVCDAGEAAATAGYFLRVDAQGEAVPARCPPGACLGNNTCAALHRGPLCASCVAGAALQLGLCRSCWAGAAPALAALVLLVAGGAATATATAAAARPAAGGAGDASAQLRASALRSSVFYLQMAAIVVSSSVRDGADAGAASLWAAVGDAATALLMLNPEALRGSCVRVAYAGSLAIRWGLALLGFALVAAIHELRLRCAAREGEGPRSRSASRARAARALQDALYRFASVVYLPLLVPSAAALSCRPGVDGPIMAADPAASCETSAFRALRGVAAALTTVLLFAPLALALAAAAVTLRAWWRGGGGGGGDDGGRGSGGEASEPGGLRAALAAATGHYRSGLRGYEAVVWARKALTALVFAFATSNADGSDSLSLALAYCVLASLMVHLAMRPFARRGANAFEALLLSGLAIVSTLLSANSTFRLSRGTIYSLLFAPLAVAAGVAAAAEWRPDGPVARALAAAEGGDDAVAGANDLGRTEWEVWESELARKSGLAEPLLSSSSAPHTESQ